MATLEQIINETRALSPTEKLKLRELLDSELSQVAGAEPRKSVCRTNEQERAWIEAHREEYLGQWVALDGSHLIAHGPDAREVYETARHQGVVAPYIERVEPTTGPFIGGWQ